MGTSVAFRVAPGVRVVPQITGPRSPFGPLLAVRGGDGPDADRADVERWRTLAGGGRVRGDEVPPSAWTGERAQLERLLNTHTARVERARRPVLAEPIPVRTHEVRTDLRKRYLEGIPSWNLRARLAARGDADRAVDDEVALRTAARATEHAATQDAADRWWRQLGNAEPRASRDQITAGLRRDELPAAATAVEAGTAFLVAVIDTPETLIGRREPSAGNSPTFPIALISDRRRNRYYLEAISSLLLTIAANTFALVAGVAQANIAVIGLHHAPQPCVLTMVELPRDSVLPDDADTPVVGNLFTIAGRTRIRLAADVDDETVAITPLPVWDTGVATALNVLERA
ncbi:MAG: hypothetical protein WD011_07690 [Nitriliruptoraceae bacterium]